MKKKPLFAKTKNLFLFFTFVRTHGEKKSNHFFLVA